jgi:hypothetical protein
MVPNERQGHFNRCLSGYGNLVLGHAARDATRTTATLMSVYLQTWCPGDACDPCGTGCLLEGADAFLTTNTAAHVQWNFGTNVLCAIRVSWPLYIDNRDMPRSSVVAPVGSNYSSVVFGSGTVVGDYVETILSLQYQGVEIFGATVRDTISQITPSTYHSVSTKITNPSGPTDWTKNVLRTAARAGGFADGEYWYAVPGEAACYFKVANGDPNTWWMRGWQYKGTYAPSGGPFDLYYTYPSSGGSPPGTVGVAKPSLYYGLNIPARTLVRPRVRVPLIGVPA